MADARPDLIYDLPGNPVAVFVDGPHHDNDQQRHRDERAAEQLENLGWTVVRVRHDDDWTASVEAHQWLFGPGRMHR